MSRKRQWIGILFLVLSVGALIAWEQWGRDYFLTNEVLLSKETIPEGTVLTADLFVSGSVEDSSIMEGAFTPNDVAKILGKVTTVTIPKNSQITDMVLRDADFYYAEDQSVYVLKGEWISLRSSSLRRGDSVELYAIHEDAGWNPLGTYQIAFVKDQNESEVVSTSLAKDKGILSRQDASSPIYNVEIIATNDEYAKILEEVMETAKTNRGSLLLVQRGELG